MKNPVKALIFFCGLGIMYALYAVTHNHDSALKMVPLSAKSKNWKSDNHVETSSVLAERNLGHMNQRKGANTVKRIVLWNLFFGTEHWYEVFPEGKKEKEINCFGRSRCILSINRTNALSYDAVVFHARDKHTPPSERSPYQVYIMYVWESPAYRSNDFMKGNSFYNWTSTYSTKSDITMKHGQWFKLPKRQPDALKALPQFKQRRNEGKAMVVWIISNCGAVSKRFNYANELKKHIKVDIYGGCGQPCPNGTGGNSHLCYEQVRAMGQYKFYLAFENSACEDYISLKPYRALNNSLVPVVLGGLSENDYIGLFPPNSYIDVRNFTSPKALADYLHVLDKDDEKYMAYLAWKTDYWVDAKFGPTFCQICDALYDEKMTRPRNVNWDEFWNAGQMCDPHLVRSLLHTEFKVNLLLVLIICFILCIIIITSLLCCMLEPKPAKLTKRKRQAYFHPTSG